MRLSSAGCRRLNLASASGSIVLCTLIGALVAGPANAQTTIPPSSAPTPNAEAPVLVIGGLCPATRVTFRVRGKTATDRTTRRGLVAVPAYRPSIDSVVIVALVKTTTACSRTKLTTFQWDPVNGWAKPAGAPPRAAV
jgi:hypothetical protein